MLFTLAYRVTEQTETANSGVTYYGLQVDHLVTSVGHKRNHNQWSTGGPFTKVSSWNKFRSGKVDIALNWFGTPYQYNDIIVPNSVSEHRLVPSDLPQSLSESAINERLATFGAEAVRRARPGREIGSAFQFLVELRDLPKRPLRQLLRSGDPSAIHQGMQFANRMKAVGSEYLNGIFGWKPFVQDLQALHQATVGLNKALNDLARNHGGKQRRRRTIVNSEDADVSTVQQQGLTLFVGTKYAPGGLLVFPLGNDSNSLITTTTKTTRHIWFAGRFSTYVPHMGEPGWTKQATRALYGLTITPEHLYQVVPWSWLMNWGNNYGAILSNLSQNSAGNLMMDYGYLMQTLRVETIVDVSIYWSGIGSILQGKGYPGSTSCSHETGWESKSRIMATPYGFGTKYDDLSGYQTSILAALGITRAKFR